MTDVKWKFERECRITDLTWKYRVRADGHTHTFIEIQGRHYIMLEGGHEDIVQNGRVIGKTLGFFAAGGYRPNSSVFTLDRPSNDPEINKILYAFLEDCEAAFVRLELNQIQLRLRQQQEERSRKISWVEHTQEFIHDLDSHIQANSSREIELRAQLRAARKK